MVCIYTLSVSDSVKKFGNVIKSTGQNIVNIYVQSWAYFDWKYYDVIRDYFT